MTRQEAIDFLVKHGYIKSDADDLSTEMLLDMVAHALSDKDEFY